jgi:RNA polymerase sigma-70 factor, ECF subfamily
MTPRPPADAAGGSVSRLLDRVQEGSDSAFADLVTRFLPRATRHARRRLGDVGRAVDPEDVALSAFHSLWRCARKEPRTGLSDRHDLLRLLATITLHKVRRARRDHTRQRRDVRRTVRDGDAPPGGASLLDAAPGREPPPEWEPAFRDTLASWLAALRPSQQEVVRLRLDGYEDKEIAGQLGCSLRTVERQLSEVRSAWRERAAGGSDG